MSTTNSLTLLNLLLTSGASAKRFLGPPQIKKALLMTTPSSDTPEMSGTPRPNKRELIAMWIWGREYATSGLSAIDFYKSLNASRNRQIDECVKQIEAASP